MFFSQWQSTFLTTKWERKRKRGERKLPLQKLKGMSKRLQPDSPQVSQKRIKRKREIDEALQVEKPKKVIHLMIYPVYGIVLWSRSPIAKSQNMLTEMVKDCLGRQVWQNANIIEKDSHLGDEFEVEQWDPAEIFLYQVENSPFTVFHFVAHMKVIRNSLPWERYRRHCRGYSRSKDSMSPRSSNC